MNTDYSILGLEPGASEAEIKKAYFKMVRLHSPESDPEQFQKIRKAYEHLKDAKTKPDGPVFPSLDDPGAIKMMQQVQTYRHEKNLKLFRDSCEEAWRRFPNDIQFLYLLIIAQRQCGNTGKAVKNAELLVGKDPDNKWFHKELAFSYKERGFTHKAFAACEKAYELGCRDIDLVLLYAGACNDNHLYDKGVSILLEIAQQDTRWPKNEIQKVVNVYTGLLIMNYHSEKQYLSEILEGLYRFLGKYSIYTKEYLPELSLLLANACMNVTYHSEEYQKVEQIFSYAWNACTTDEEKEIIDDSINLYYFQRIVADPRIDDMLVSYLELFLDSDEEDLTYQKFAATDIQLCMIEQREDVLKQAAVIKQEHPHIYEKIADFVQKLENAKKIGFLKDSLLKTYQRLEPMYMGGQYYELYPQEKIKAMGTLINEGNEYEPYVRSTKKIGRNDPCPCGSGRKYKHCCMNK